MQFDGFRLRPFQAGDELVWFDYLRLPEVASLSGWPIASPQELIALLSNTPGETATRFAIADAGNRLAGTGGFVDDEDGDTELAYDLAPRFWGRGIATAACQALSDWGFAELGLASIKACVLHSNRASARVLEKCGFKPMEMVKQARHADGMARDYMVYRRLRHDLRQTPETN